MGAIKGRIPGDEMARVGEETEAVGSWLAKVGGWVGGQQLRRGSGAMRAGRHSTENTENPSEH